MRMVRADPSMTPLRPTRGTCPRVGAALFWGAQHLQPSARTKCAPEHRSTLAAATAPDDRLQCAHKTTAASVCEAKEEKAAAALVFRSSRWFVRAQALDERAAPLHKRSLGCRFKFNLRRCRRRRSQLLRALLTDATERTLVSRCRKGDGRAPPSE